MQRLRQLVSALMLVVVLGAPGLPGAGSPALAASYPLDATDSEIEDALGYLRQQQDADGGIGGFGASAWAVMAVAAAGEDPHEWEASAGVSIIDYLETEADTSLFAATDWARMILAIVAADEDPTDFGGEDYVEGLEALYCEDPESELVQLGQTDMLNDDFWGVLALSAAGVSIGEDVVNFIEYYQNEDGGWNHQAWGDSDVDNTSAAVMALIAAGESPEGDVVQGALLFLEFSQNQDDGGFPFEWPGESNAASDAWAIAALEAAGEDPSGIDWTPSGTSVVDHLLGLQDSSDGFFNWQSGDSSNSEWMTSYAIPALLGMPYPIEGDFPQSAGDPEIGRTPTSLSFTATENGSNPLDKVFEIWNEGDGSLDWEVSDDAAWLSLSPSSGSSTGELDEVMVSVDVSGLAADTHGATITITCEDADNSPRTVAVTLDVAEAATEAEVAFVPDEFDFEAEENGSDPGEQVLELWNAGPGSLDWEVESDESWLSLSPDDGSSSGEHDAVTLSVDIDGLDAGDYEATVTISWDDGGSSETIDVNLEVTGGASHDEPEIDFSPSNLKFEAEEGGDDPDEETLKIWNAGEGDMDWEVKSNEDWLSLSPRRGSSSAEKDEVDVSVDISGLDEGQYTARITITSDDADNSPERLTVALTIGVPDDAGYYLLTTLASPSGAGSISRSVAAQASGYADGTSVTLTAAPVPGYAFTGWFGDVAGPSNPIVVAMTANRTVTAKFVRFDAAGLNNVSLTYASPDMSLVSVIPYPVASIPSSPQGFHLLSAYVVEPQGTGSFSLQFDGLADAANVAVFKVVDGMWVRLPRAVMGETSIQVTLPAEDPVLALAYPGSSTGGFAKTVTDFFAGADGATIGIVAVIGVLALLIVLVLFVFGRRRDDY